jgi:predicted amidophosphoribosyltransferase
MDGIKKFISGVGYQAGKLLFPPHCARCRLLLDQYMPFCVPCEQKIMPVVSTVVKVSARYDMTVFALSGYEEPLRSLILAKGRSDLLASRQLGELLLQRTPIKQLDVDYFIPVPLHWTRFAYRGYNQAYEIARVVANGRQKPVANAVKRVTRTSFQATLTPEKRWQNVHDVFCLVGDGALYRDKHIVLVDDLMTTSATLQSVAKVMITCKPASITAVVACRVV